MAIVSMAQAATSTTGSTKQWKAASTVYKKLIDMAVAATTKGSALTNADVIEAIRIPAGCVVQGAGMYIVTAVNGSADQTATLGDGGDTARYATGFDFDAATAGAMTAAIPAKVPFHNATADTIDIAFTAGTTIATTGKILVWAEVTDINDNEFVGTALFTG